MNSADVVHIHKQAQVTFAIGDYINTLTCDVAPMDCAQVLLGKPWQYDRRVIYDGYQNIYRIRKDGQEYLLLPMTSVEVQRERFEHVRAKGQRSLFLFPCRFEKRTKPQNSQEIP